MSLFNCCYRSGNLVLTSVVRWDGAPLLWKPSWFTSLNQMDNPLTWILPSSFPITKAAAENPNSSSLDFHKADLLPFWLSLINIHCYPMLKTKALDPASAKTFSPCPLPPSRTTLLSWKALYMNSPTKVGSPGTPSSTFIETSFYWPTAYSNTSNPNTAQDCVEGLQSWHALGPLFNAAFGFEQLKFRWYPWIFLPSIPW